MTEDRLVAVARELVDTLVPGFEPVRTAGLLVGRSRDLLGADSSVVMPDGPGGRPRLVAASTRRVREVELVQLGSMQGPGLAALRAGSAVEWPDLGAADCPWRLFAEAATRRDVWSVDALPLRARGRTFGVFSLFGSEPGGLAPEARLLASKLARLAAIGLLRDRRAYARQRRNRELQADLDRRILLEQAVGVLAERWQLSVRCAAENLTAIARTHRQPEHVVAAAVLASVPRPRRGK